jgi:hypothetical protein
VARREGRGSLAIVAPVADSRLTDQAIRKERGLNACISRVPRVCGLVL